LIDAADALGETRISGIGLEDVAARLVHALNIKMTAGLFDPAAKI
jgi:hypothetical protein